MKKELGMFIALLVMCLIIGVSNKDFYGAENLVNQSRQIAMLATFAIGIAFVIATGGIDLSVGSVIGLSGVIIARISAPSSGSSLASGMGQPLWVGITAALAITLAIGVIQGLLITRMGLQPFIVTLSGMLLIRGASQTITHGGNISFGDSTFPDFVNNGWRITSGFTLTYPVILFLVLALLFAYLLHFTVFGRHIFAIGGNRDAARYSGVPVQRVELTAYVISSFLAGVAGIPYAAYIGQMSHTVGGAFELHAIAAAVLGGVSLRGGEGTVLGVVIGSAVMKVMENGINMFKLVFKDAQGHPRDWHLDENWHDIVIGAVILGAIILDQVTHILRDRRKTKGA